MENEVKHLKPVYCAIGPNDFPMKYNIEFKLGEPNDPTADIYWIFTGNYSSLCNFYIHPVTVDIGRGLIEYKTSEHAFAAAKAFSLKDHDRILKAATPGAAKAAGRNRKLRLREHWDYVKYQIMLDIVRAKMEQCAVARECLRSTGNRKIYEGNTWKDDIWGVVKSSGDFGVPGSTFQGRNSLGEILMMVRKEMF